MGVSTPCCSCEIGMAQTDGALGAMTDERPVLHEDI